MLKNYFKTAIRNLSRNRTYTVINVLGLALGISAALVLFKYVIFEKSFDNYLSNYDSLYRFTKRVESPNLIDLEGGVPNPFAEAFNMDYPALGTACRTFYTGENQLSVKDATGNWTHYEQKDGIAFADSTFFQLFSYDWKVGNPETALNQPGSAVISTSLAEKFFGVTDGGYDRVLGKDVKMNNRVNVFISGVVADPPKNASVPFKLIMAYESVAEIFDFYQPNSWTSTSSNAQVFFLANKNVTQQQIEAVLPGFSEKYIPATENKTSFHVQSLEQMHYEPEFNTYANSAIDKDLLTVPIAVGIFLILTACVNFVNLSTALAIKRSKEVGIRKVLGGHKRQLIFQFLGETFLITILSVLISIGIAELVMSNLGELLGYELSLDLLNDSQLLTMILTVIIGVTLFAGLYPSFVLSKLKPVSVLRGKGQTGLSGNINTRRGLVIFQFFISQVLVICTLVVVSQMEYFNSSDLGFQKESIITFPLPSPEASKLEVIRNELTRFPGVENVSYAYGSPLSSNNIGSTFGYAPLEIQGQFDVAYKVIDEHYLDLYEIELLAGRDIKKNDTLTEALLSMEALMLMEMDDPNEAIGKEISSGFSGPKTVVGVFKDFHNKDLKEKRDPMVMVKYPDYFSEGALKFNGSVAQTDELLQTLEKTWSAQYPETLFDYTLLSEAILENYQEESDMLALFQVFSGIAILIGCLGLYGLVSFMASQKRKEIGVRKVLGATTNQILNIFSKEMLVLIAIAFLVAVPFGYYFMNNWLSGFEYRIELDVWVFAIAIVFTLVVGLITTGLRSFQAATSNPVDSLRSE